MTILNLQGNVKVHPFVHRLAIEPAVPVLGCFPWTALSPNRSARAFIPLEVQRTLKRGGEQFPSYKRFE